MTTASTSAPPLTYDDLIDLHFLLEADELFVQLIGDSLLVGESR